MSSLFTIAGAWALVTLEMPWTDEYFPRLRRPRKLPVVYAILLQPVAETLLTLARDHKHLGAEIAFCAVLQYRSLCGVTSGE